MKFMHLSDLHIGIRLYHFDLIEDQRFVLRQIIQCAETEQPDAVVIAGDIFDKSVPSSEAVKLFDEFMTELANVEPDMTIMIISGNHDSARRLDCFRHILKKEQIYMVGLPPEHEGECIERVTLSDEFGEVHFYLLPFVRPAAVRGVVGEQVNSYDEAIHLLLAREDINESERNVLVSHQFYVRDKKRAHEVERAETEVYTIGNIDATDSDCMAPFDYVALGHLHKPMKVERDTVRYCGTPMPYSLSEEGQEKGILIVTLGEKGTEPNIQKVSLVPRRNVRNIYGTLEEVLSHPSEDYMWVTLTEKPKLDISDVQVRLRTAFPFLLGMSYNTDPVITREHIPWMQLNEVTPFDLFMQFCPELEEEDQDLLKDVIHTVKGVI